MVVFAFLDVVDVLLCFVYGFLYSVFEDNPASCYCHGSHNARHWRTTSRSTPPARPDSAPSPPLPFLPWKPSLVESRDWTQRFFQGLGVGAPLPAPVELHGTYSALVRGVLSSSTVSASASPCISCTLRRSPSPSPPS
ncbi:hypothetical protein OsJ_31567 [Oryza sativa Japonica Group]|uniref:Uncharacterized protein n=1 Tax=Oryza sativa subsp. japonica TaxID=39947 RepID=B9G5T6_ORYSJ|nr:hypothetical protein OsJ_31567 [Oryza sativa Japonica Group]